MDVNEVEEEIDGSIHSIHVRNFFCHDNLEINFNKNINFIVGRNGSGKSAILTALVVGLGGRASATNRGNNLHSFIKKGANSATIEIKIKNSTPRAYKHDIYGNYITVVRNLTLSGGSSYKVKSTTGEVISTKFEEVNAITLAHDIQVDNPISVLNQDDARSFHASDAKKKYSLFRKATNLDQTETNYIKALENCKKANSIWDRKNEACKELEKEYKKWKASYEQLQSKDEIEARKQALQNEYYWSEIMDLEREVTTVQDQYNKQKYRINSLVEKLKKINENYGSNNSVIISLRTHLEEKTLEKSTLEQRISKLDEEGYKINTEWRSVQNIVTKQTELLNREKRKVYDLESEIENIDSGRSSNTRAALEEARRVAAVAAEAAQLRYSTAQNDAAQARAHAQHAQQQADRAQEDALRQRNKTVSLKQQLRELESRGNDSLAVYGNNMVDLCQRIKQGVAKGDFSTPPRGPVGSYIKVRDKKWGGALEHILGGNVQTFCVNTPEDSRKLFQIMGKVYGSAPKPGVTCSKFLNQRHDVRQNKVKASGFLSALDSLDISDPVVANFLIDNVSLEKILMVQNHEDAVRLSDTVENVPENCARVVTADCSEYLPAPHYRCYGGVARSARYLHLSTAERKRQVVAEIKEAETSLRTLEETAAELGAEAKRARENERVASQTLQALLADRHRKDEAERVAAGALEMQQAPQHAVLLEELNISKEKLKTLGDQLEVLCRKEEQNKQKAEANTSTSKDLKNRLAQINTACRTLNDELDQQQLRLEQDATTRQMCEQKLNEDNTKMAHVKAIIEEKERIIKTKIEEALTLCPRIENPREKLVVTNELKKTEMKLSSLRSGGLSREEVLQRLLHAEGAYRRNTRALSRLHRLIAEIEKTADKHLNFCQRMQTYIARKVQHCFQSILTLRGYSGRMDIDNARGVLEIFCTGRESSAKRHASSTSSLSGGERSYSTVAFIMSLWECVELPFYFMDEFDVFMDNVNRKIVMELLVEHARQASSRQFVFLTPQDASSLTAGPNLAIHLMADPRP